jgi:hypothetical protein
MSPSGQGSIFSIDYYPNYERIDIIFGIRVGDRLSCFVCSTFVGAGTSKYIKSLNGANSALQLDTDYFLVNQIIKNAAAMYEIDGSIYAMQVDPSSSALAKQDLVEMKTQDEECTLFCLKNSEEDAGDRRTDFEPSPHDH